ncbi:MAG: hypothetical protein GF370_00150 [Candidatus Nealsonbacteria bacterium]|nr:hypothetical protein [Candidatus Nealsonbacteria bacterium]
MVFQLFQELSYLGYVGLFLISLFGSATIIFPLPAAGFIFAAAAPLNPFILAAVTGIGAAVGEVVGYVLGWGGRKIGEKKLEKDLERAEKMFDRYGGFITLIIFAATPLPDDVVGIISGVLNYDIKKFFLAVSIGKTIFHLIVALAGHYGITAILKYI